MALVDRTSIRRHGMTAIVAAVLTALAVASSGPARGQDTGDTDGAPANTFHRSQAVTGVTVRHQKCVAFSPAISTEPVAWHMRLKGHCRGGPARSDPSRGPVSDAG